MFKIKGSTIHCSRGDIGNILLKLPITDRNNYLKYIDTNEDIFWYDSKNKILYDNNYIKSEISISTLTQVFYEFIEGDIVKLNIYEKNGYNKQPLKTKSVIVETAGDSITISLLEEDTTFGEASNKEIIYWYDITLNDDLTVVCYDEDGAKEFIIYPAKGADE